MESDVVDSNAPKQSESEEVSRMIPLQISVTEKVIFCIDSLVFFNFVDGCEMINKICNMLRLYFTMKKKISIKPVEFQCLFFLDNDIILQKSINQSNDVFDALLKFDNIDLKKESEPFDFNVVFTSLAETVELPDPNVYNDLPPPYVYHCILLFGHNFYEPILKETNAFNFLMQNPFFTLDIVYICNNVTDNKCNLIKETLFSLNKKNRGYNFLVNVNNIEEQFNIFAQLLGHPLIRCPQNLNQFNIGKTLFSKK